jgi:hypothetical protein
MLSGAALGFGFYLKEITPMMLAAYVVWGGITAVRDRRGLRVAWVLLGFAAFMLLGAIHWYIVTGDPLYNIHRIMAVQHRVSAWVGQPRANRVVGESTFTMMIARQWLFGPVMVLTPLFVLVFAFARRLRYRMLLLILFALLAYAEYRTGVMAVRQRYLLLIMLPTLVIGAAALETLANRLPRRAAPVALTALVALTPLGLLTSKPQWHWNRMESTRTAQAVLAQLVQSDQPVFTDPRTMMILYQMNGFKPYAGGLYRYVQELPRKERWAREVWWDKPFEHVFNAQYGVHPDGLELASRSAGWVVYNQRLAEFCAGRKVPIPAVVKNPPPNWVEVGSWGDGWPVTLYLIQPVRQTMSAVSLSGPAEEYRTPRDRGVVRNTLALAGGKLSAAMVFGATASDSALQYGGVRLPVKSSAFRLQLAFRNVGNISTVSVYAGDAKGIVGAWRAYGSELPAEGTGNWYEFGSGTPRGPFAPMMKDSGAAVEFVDVVVTPSSPGAQVGLEVEGVEY